jgi:hypothetical protein
MPFGVFVSNTTRDLDHWGSWISDWVPDRQAYRFRLADSGLRIQACGFRQIDSPLSLVPPDIQPKQARNPVDRKNFAG